MPTHINTRYEEIEALWPGIENYQKLAEHYGIKDIFQDAGGKMLQLAIATGLDLKDSRVGADACDRSGNLYEIKTADISSGTVRGFSTNHHLNYDTIRRYKPRRWVFAFYHGITLMEVYRLEPDQMQPVFDGWVTTLQFDNRSHINNPKIKFDYVRKNGTVMYLKDVPPDWATTKAS